MIPYGISDKGCGKLHSADKCESCAERKPPCKRRARNRAKLSIDEEIAADTMEAGFTSGNK